MTYLLLLLLLYLQEIDLQVGADWESLARPWMSEQERTLYDQLSATEQQLFRGYFVARRLDDPKQWPATGSFLPALHCARLHGDIRDQIIYALGQPKRVKAQPLSPQLPASWSFEGTELLFEPMAAGKVRLARSSRKVWEGVKRRFVKHPHLYYDFLVKSFGRTRLPEEVQFQTVKVSSTYSLPQQAGSSQRIHLPIPESYRNNVRQSKANPVQHMELLVRLKPVDGVVSQTAGEVRHASQRLNLLQESYLTFDVYLPPGYFESELLVYSGYLDKGLRAEMTIAVLPPSLPRISDPIISQRWTATGVEQFGNGQYVLAGTTYKAAPVYLQKIPARVLVYSDHEVSRVLLQASNQEERWLSLRERHGPWIVFELPPQENDFRLLSFGFPASGEAVALGSLGPLMGGTEESAPSFDQQGKPNYLGLKELSFGTPGNLNLLLVNEKPYLASRTGRFDWRGMDWGKVAHLRYEYKRGTVWYHADFKLRRRGVYEQLSVKPSYLVAGTRRLGGQIAAAEVRVTVLGRPVKIEAKTPYKQLSKLWGIVVNEPLLKSPHWALIRNALKQWLKDNIGRDDLVYVVHNSDRPRLLQPPTRYKPLLNAALEALLPQTRDNPYFTVQYLVDALTHMPQHQTRAHQVLLLTDGLSDEASQMEDLIPQLRRTGLQLYHLEFPFVSGKNERLKPDPNEEALVGMAVREEDRRRRREGFRDHFLEDRDGVSVRSWSFGGKKRKQLRRQERLREAAFHEAFNQQLATLTAGLSLTAGVGETSASLKRFFGNLTAWQETLVHLELSVPYLEQDLVRVEAASGYSAAWTLVGWHPKSIPTKEP